MTRWTCLRDWAASWGTTEMKPNGRGTEDARLISEALCTIAMSMAFLNTDLGCLPACALFPSRRDHRSICDRSYAMKDSSQKAGHMWMAVHPVATHSSCHSLFTAF
ncbi:hypothetical protein FJTKL_14667 [Diaporthe vaccinii]|uniref:Uncharacterized protein n=1 Tax=Diaporthe vaccinii TaxID=105482 RepID=A0ABR4F7H6_9PEZI